MVNLSFGFVFSGDERKFIQMQIQWATNAVHIVIVVNIEWDARARPRKLSDEMELFSIEIENAKIEQTNREREDCHLAAKNPFQTVNWAASTYQIHF